MADVLEGRRVFVSSTFKDLARHRSEVRKYIRRLDAIDIAMENFGALDERPRDACVQLVREGTDVFVGIYAYRYGTVPPGDRYSITEEEYIAARNRRLPMFIYDVNKRYRWPQRLREAGVEQQLAAFKARFPLDGTPSSFTSAGQLATAVIADLGRHFAASRDERLVERGQLWVPPIDWVSPARSNRNQFKVAAFDLDGTLFRGDDFVFSWDLLWSGLGFARRTQDDLKRRYLRASRPPASKADRIRAYEAWCDAAVEKFRAAGLTRSRLREMSVALRLTANCREALRQLRDAGVTTALISGGINTFLEDVFPDYRDYFDFVFINELTFDDNQVVEGVLATAYDFEGKLEALKRVCARVGCTTDEAVFVGDQINDRDVLLSSGLGIAYPASELVVTDAAGALVAKDDLLEVSAKILEP
jgi:HAD superfamily phosphoserine phosphatase-like hydrolase